ncbi:MAG: polysaccharide deacetylase family protein [Ktedonobacteraceae bacterium]|nr:polysaccharide deacetylase family protein [Ktedonobacteraceae bacterium]
MSMIRRKAHIPTGNRYTVTTSQMVQPSLESSRRRSLLIILLLVTSAVLVMAAIAMASYLLISPATHKSVTTAQKHTIVSPVSDGVQSQVTASAQQFMNALIQGQYDEDWSSLAPQIQAKWPDQQAFSHYLKKRFDGYMLKGFTLGQVQALTYWVDPETMIRYDNVVVIPTVLQIESQIPPAQRAQLAPQFQQSDQLYQHVPLIMQRQPDAGDGGKDRWAVLSAGPADPEAPILPPLHPAYKVVRVPILMYHHISDVPTKNLLDFSLTIKGTTFNQQLDFLRQQGYHSITLNELMDALYFDMPMPSKPIIFTFDDGYDDAYAYAYPILKAHGYSGMFYIITGKVGWQGQATWEQLRDMLANGMQIGSHTIHHVEMGSVYRASPQQARQEAQISQQTLQQHLGIVIQHFCYPNGSPFKNPRESVLRDKIVSLLAKSGYIDATTDPGPTGIVQDSRLPFMLLRLRIDGRESLKAFENVLRGL